MRSIIMAFTVLIAGCASDTEERPALGTLVRERIPAGIWYTTTNNGRIFTAWRTGGTPDALWVIIDGQDRTVMIACHDLYIDTVVEVCELMEEKKPLPIWVADQVYRSALGQLVGQGHSTPRPRISGKPKNLAEKPKERST